MCSFRFPIEVTFPAEFDAGRVHIPRSLFGLRDASRVSPGRSPMRYHTQDAEGVENEEPKGSPGREWEP